MKIVIEISNKRLEEKIINILKAFEEYGLIIKEIDEEVELSDEFIEKYWKVLALDTISSERDDDEIIYEAAGRFYNEKHSD